MKRAIPSQLVAPSESFDDEVLWSGCEIGAERLGGREVAGWRLERSRLTGTDLRGGEFERWR